MINKRATPFFIIGSQRSGTTLLRLMLNAHSQIAIPEEGGFWMPLLRDYRKVKAKTIKKAKLRRYIDYIESNPQFSLWNLEANLLFEALRIEEKLTLRELMSLTYAEFSRAHGKQIWGDKTPSFFRMVPVLKKVFPDAKFIHLIRDGRDIYLSLKRIDKGKRNISVQALEWVYKVRKARRDLSILKPSQILELKYEDLVSSSAQILKKTCDFLQIRYEDEMLEYWKNSDKFIGAHHSNLIFQPVSSKSVSKWKLQMTNRQLNRYEAIAGPLLMSYGYELTNQRPHIIIDYPILALELALGLPKRAARVVLTALNMKLSANFGIRIFSEKVGELPKGAVKKGFTIR